VVNVAGNAVHVHILFQSNLEIGNVHIQASHQGILHRNWNGLTVNIVVISVCVQSTNHSVVTILELVLALSLGLTSAFNDIGAQNNDCGL